MESAAIIIIMVLAMVMVIFISIEGVRWERHSPMEELLLSEWQWFLLAEMCIQSANKWTGRVICLFDSLLAASTALESHWEIRTFSPRHRRFYAVTEGLHWIRWTSSQTLLLILSLKLWVLKGRIISSPQLTYIFETKTKSYFFLTEYVTSVNRYQQLLLSFC